MQYYRSYGFGRADVNRKLAEGEIQIGKPALKDGQECWVNYEGRYETKFNLKPTMNMTDDELDAFCFPDMVSPDGTRYPMTLPEPEEDTEQQPESWDTERFPLPWD